MSRGNKRSGLTLLLAPPAILGALLALSSLEFVRHLENLTVDWRFRARVQADAKADPRILPVGIGEYSLRRHGRWEEWTREIHADFLEQLSLRPPLVVAYDLFFSEPGRDRDIDTGFADWLALFPGAVTGAVADDSRPDAPPYAELSIGKTPPLQVTGDPTKLIQAPGGLLPIQEIAESAWTGFVNSPPSRIDGMRRRIPLVVGLGGEVYPSFVLQILMRLDRVRSDGVEVILGDAVVLTGRGGGQRRVPIDEQGMMLLNYRGGEAFEPVDYAALRDLLAESAATGHWPGGAPPVEGQILLIGQMAEGLTDFGPTPLKPREPLVLVQAIALDNILREDYLAIVPLWPVLAGWLPLAWLTLWFLRRSSAFWCVALPLSLSLGYGFLGFLLFRASSVQLPLVLPVLGLIAVHGGVLVDRLVAEGREKRRVRSLFGTFVSPEVVDQIIASGEEPKLGGQATEITALFSDIQGFSTFSEQLDPERLVALMIEYLSEMTEIMLDRGGSLDKYIGDAMVGMFGAPLPLADHAHRACRVAIEIQQRQAELREKWRAERTWPEIVPWMRTRIGLNTGVAVIGNMGSRRRFNYTMMGDSVNLAARCESGAKAYGVFTMVTGETRRAAAAAKDDIVFRYLDKIVVKGRCQPVEMFEVIGFASELPAGTQDCLDAYEEGMADYASRDWDGACDRFQRSAILEPFQPRRDPGVSTNPSLVMIKRCAELKASPPGEDWDGVHAMESK